MKIGKHLFVLGTNLLNMERKYKLNLKTLKYERQERVIEDFIVKKVLPKFAFTAVLGISLGIAATYYIGSPAEREGFMEAKVLNEKYNNINTQLRKALVELTDIQAHDDGYRSVFQVDPLTESQKAAGFGGTDRYSNLKNYANSEIMVSTAYNIDKMISTMKIQTQSFETVTKLVKNKEKMLACIPSIQPIAIKDLIRHGSPFGYRFHPILHIYRMHAGVDLTAKEGTPIYATGQGKVIAAGGQNGYGNVVKIDHGFGYTTVYAHMSKIAIKNGQKVNRGDIIGYVGCTGLSTSPHCHYEVRINNKPVDPMNFYKSDMTEEEYQIFLAASQDLAFGDND